ncbi:putative phage abortive infection protein [Sphingomonas sp. LT1P40]|uniref:putative phage abortive infection protein n=1 Tax=Alteristakelama amylovorans TaxID=3096166 RepID=UPI002FC9AC89
MDFSLSGTFGDSFGPASALMAAVAAVGAWSAVGLQREEIRKLEKQRLEDRMQADDRDFDVRFFQLLSAFEEIVASARYVQHHSSGPLLRTGRDAIGLFAREASDAVEGKIGQDAELAYAKWFDDHKDTFGHYFRFLYHLVIITDDLSHNSVRLMLFLRAKLSESELQLLAMNCAFGEGRNHFCRLVEKYHFFHNLSAEAIYRLSLRNYFNSRAFEGGMSGKFLGRFMEKEIAKRFGLEALLIKNGDTLERHYLNNPDALLNMDK